MARNRCRKGGHLRRLLLLALVLVVFYIATHVGAYLADQQYLQHYVDTHTTAPAALPLTTSHEET